jgi:putative aldouronate transport system substrate-binding protein
MKKLTVFTVLICIASLTFAKGKNEGGVKTSAPTSPITISIFHETGARPKPSPNNPIAKYLKNRLNVSFTWDILAGDIAERRVNMFVAGKYPDILEIRGNEWIDAGVLIPLEGLIEQHGPRIKAHYKDVWEKMKSRDGHIYYLINYGVLQGKDQSPDYNQAAFWVQKAVLEDAGYPKIATVDQFFDMIDAYYRKNPTINGQPTIPFTILTYDYRAFELWNPPNFLSGNPNDGNGIVNPLRDYEYKTFFTMDISKRWFKKLNEMNTKGLIDKAGFTDSHDQYSAKIAAGRVLGQSVQGWQFGSANNAARDLVSNSRAMVPLPIVFDTRITPRYRNLPFPNLLRGMGISVSAKDPVRIIRFINDYLSEDVQRTINWGIEGQHWQKGPGGEPYRTPEQRANWQNEKWQEQNRLMLMEAIFPKIEGSFSDGYPHDLSFYFPEREALLHPEDLELFKAYGVNSTNELMDKNPPQNAPWFPTWNMPSPPDGHEAQLAYQRCVQTMKQRLPQIILAPPADFERLWAAYVAEMRDNGIDRYEAFMQDQLNLRLKNWGIKK